MAHVKQGTLKRDARFILGIAFVLTLIGLVFIYSSSSVFALEKFGSSYYFLKKQVIFLIPSFAGFLMFVLIPLSFWKRFAPYCFLLALILTILTLIPSLGLKVHGSYRWLRIGGISVQPSEVLKLFLIIYLGFFLEKKQDRITSFVYGYLPFLIVLGITFIVLLKQPDFGSVVTLLSTTFILLFVAEFKTIHLLLTVAAVVPLGILLVLKKAYRLNRILIFLNPWSDARGRGFQIIQSLIAIGSGSLWGVGISYSKQKYFYLPMQHTDFIFSIIAEETGFIGSLVIISLYFLFCYFGLRVVLHLENTFARFTLLGFIVLISLQAVINLMVASGLLPTKGLGLPFISYGGTALVIFWCMIGFLVASVREQRI
jgi:cell division protein FtsW